MRALLTVFLLLLVAGAFLLLRGHQPEGPPAGDALERDGDPEGAAPDLRRTTTGAERDGPSNPAAATRRGDAPAAGRPAAVVGRVEDESGLPIAGAIVRVAHLDGRALRGGLPADSDHAPLAEGRSEPDGTFRLAVSQGAWLRVEAEAPGHAVGATWVAGPGAWIRVVLPAAAGPLIVTALDAEARAVSGARVEVTAGRALVTGQTDESGMCRLENVPPGTVSARVDAGERGRGLGGPIRVARDRETRLTVLVDALVPIVGHVRDEATGLPVAGAEVHAARPGASRVAAPTASDGAFRCDGLGRAGERVLIAVRAPGYRPALLPVHLADTDHAHEVEVVLTAEPDWSGRVVDEGGRPVEGARVTTTPDGIHGREPPMARTDVEGRFQLPPPPPPAPGRRVVLVADAAERGIAAVALRPDDPRPVDLVLVLSRGSAVRGRIVDAKGGPMAAVGVRLDPVWRALPDRRDPGPQTSRLLALNETGRMTLTTATDTEGRFRLEDVPDGTYRTRLTHGAANRQLDPVFEVAGSDVDVGTLRLDDGFLLEGRVTARSGRPLAGAEVRVVPAGVTTQTQRARTTGEGLWRVTGIPAGSVRVDVRLDGFRPAQEDLRVEEDVTVDVALDAGATLQGRVSVAGTPYAGVFTLSLEVPERSRSVLRRTRRAGDGGFEVEGAPEGTWDLVIGTPGGQTRRVPVSLHADGLTDLGVIELEAASSVAGRLTDAQGQPVVGGRVTVAATGLGRRRAVTTGAEGAWRIQGLVPGPYDLEATGRGGAPTGRALVLASGEERRLDLDLLPAGRLAIRVSDAQGRGVAGATVLVREEGGRFRAWPRPARSDADGRTELRDLPPGPVEVVARARDGRVGQQRAEVRANGRDSVVITLARPAAHVDGE